MGRMQLTKTRVKYRRAGEDKVRAKTFKGEATMDQIKDVLGENIFIIQITHDLGVLKTPRPRHIITLDDGEMVSLMPEVE